MAKYTLENNFDFDFPLFLIICHESEYRLCSLINKALGIDLSREKPLELKNKKQIDALNFSVFSFVNENETQEYYLVNNLSANASKTEQPAKATAQASLFDEVPSEATSQKGRLLPELTDTDFFFLLKGDFSETEKNKIIKQLGAIEIIKNVKETDPNKLQSKNNLLF